MGCHSISPRPQCPKSKQPLSPQTALYPCEKRLPQWVKFLYSAIHLQQLKVNKTHPKVSAVLTHSSSGACTQKKLLNRWLHLWSHGEKLSQKKKKHLLHVESRELSGPFSVLWPQMVWSWPVPMISFAGSDSVNAATSISTVGNVWWCDSVLSIPANNGNVKDCKIRKSLLASQYYLFWLSFYTETAKLKKKKMSWQQKHWLKIIEWGFCSHWHD